MIHQIQTARRILTDWLGDGGQPVPIEQAQARANVCLNCPYNFQGKWLWSTAIRLVILSQERLRASMKRHVDGEERLGICYHEDAQGNKHGCRCKLKLKVEVPFKHIAKHTTDKEFEELPAHCWQRIEYEKQKADKHL